MPDGSDNPFSGGRPADRRAGEPEADRHRVLRRSPRGTLSLVGLAAYARAGLCTAVFSAGGCLAAPPSGTPGTPDTPDGGDPACTVFFEDTFDDPDLTEAFFTIDQDPPDAVVAIGGGNASLEARGSTNVGYASLRTQSTFGVTSSALEIETEVEITGAAVVILSLDSDGDVSYDLRGHSDHVAVSHDDEGGSHVDCDPCASFGDGAWTMRIEERAGALHFLAGPQGDTPTDLLPDGIPGGDAEMFGQVWLLAPESSDTAHAAVSSITWSVCGE